MRLGARPNPDLGAQLERAASGAPVAVGGCGGFAGVRVSNIVRQRIVQCLGSCIRIEDTQEMFAMKHGERVNLGYCTLERTPLRFDFWVPHDGIAIDYRERGDAEVQAKVAWADEHRLFYAYAGPENAQLGSAQILNQQYFDQLAMLIDERRQKVRPHG